MSEDIFDDESEDNGENRSVKSKKVGFLLDVLEELDGQSP